MGILQRIVAVGSVLFLLALSGVQADELRDHRLNFAIDAPTLTGALLQFAKQANLQLVVPREIGTRTSTPRLRGSYTPRGALDELLKNSGLTYEFINDRTVEISARPATHSDART